MKVPIGKWLLECEEVAVIRSFLRRRSSRSFWAKSDLLAILWCEKKLMVMWWRG